MERINYTILCQKNIRIISFQTLSVFVLSAEAAKSCFHGANAAFDPGAFHPGQSMNAELAKMTDTT